MLPLIVAFFFTVGALIYAAHDMNQSQVSAVSESRIDALTSAFILYHDAVTTYAIAHPAATGTISDANLLLPNWFKNPGLTNSILSNGTARTWITSTATTLPERDSLLYALHIRLRGYSNSGRVVPNGYFNAAIGFIADAASTQGIPANSTLLFTKMR